MRAAALALLAALAAPAHAQGDILPFASAQEAQRISEEEGRVWGESASFDKSLKNRGHLYGDAALDGYVQGLVDALFPEFAGILRVRVVNNPQLNAFALPNGSLYINLGLIARMENEAQLAAVLAHEGGHFVARHGLRQRQNLKGSAAFALGAGLVAGNVGALLGNLAALSSIYGYSRDLEREADAVSFERLQRVGYSTKEGARVFDILDTEAKLLDAKEPFMFSSHPKLQERIESFTELAAKAAGGPGRVDAERFLARTAAVRQAWLEAELALAQHKSLLHHLTLPAAAGRFPAWQGYYLGEAYLLRGEAEDEKQAEAAYRAALAAAPDFAPSYRALGLLLMKRRTYATAREMLEQYLSRAPAAPDAAYVKSYVEQIRQLEAQPPTNPSPEKTS